MDFFKILKGGVGVGMSNFDRLFAEKHGGGAWQLTTLTGALPLSFKSKGTPLTDYKLYGTSEGAGAETESGEPTGYKLPMTVESGEKSTTTLIYIGDSKLGAEEYLDYGEQKVYKRTENEFDFEEAVPRKYIDANGVEQNSSATDDYVATSHSGYMAVTPNENYTFKAVLMRITTLNHTISFCWYDSSKTFITRDTNTATGTVQTYQFTGTAPANAAFCIMNFTGYNDISKFMFVLGSTAPETYIPYLQPTDPPVALPELSTYQGENTLSCSEGLGEVSITGYIKGE